MNMVEGPNNTALVAVAPQGPYRTLCDGVAQVQGEEIRRQPLPLAR